MIVQEQKSSGPNNRVLVWTKKSWTEKQVERMSKRESYAKPGLCRLWAGGFSMPLKALSLELYCFDFETFGEGWSTQSRTLLSQSRSKQVCFSRSTSTPSPELYYWRIGGQIWRKTISSELYFWNWSPTAPFSGEKRLHPVQNSISEEHDSRPDRPSNREWLWLRSYG